MSDQKIKYQRIEINVDGPGGVFPIDVETNKLFKRITNIDVILTNIKAVFSSLELAINTKEIFPEGCEVVRILFKEQAPFGYDSNPLDEPAGGSRVKGKYTDVPNGAAYPYKAIITLTLEND